MGKDGCDLAVNQEQFNAIRLLANNLIELTT